MGLVRQGDQQGTMYLAWDGIPRSRGHAFYDHLLQILRGSGFDAFAEKRHCAASFSLRDFLQLSTKESVPGHSSLSRTRFRLPLTTHQEVFTWILKVRNKDGLVFGGRIGVDASGMEANAALQPIARRDTGESYRKMLLRMAKESGRASPTDENLARMDRKRVSKTLSNKNWQSQVDPEARIIKMKNGRTHLSYKPEHAVDLATGAGEVHEMDKGDTSTLQKTLEAAQESLRRVTQHRHARTILRTESRTRAISRRMSSRIRTVGHGGQESPNPSARACTTGGATTRPDAPCTTTALG